MRKGRARFLSVFTLVSRVPVRASFEPDYSRSDFWIPAISPLVSLSAASGAALCALAFGQPHLAAIGALAVQYLAFNLFHLDGLLDSADALMGWASRERRLEILKDSRIGSYAFFAGGACLAAKLALLASIFGGGLLPAAVALAAYPLSGRLASALIPLVSKPARPDGLGALMGGFSPLRYAAGACAGLAFIALAGAAGLGVAPLGAAARAAGLGACAALVGAAASGIPVARAYAKKVGGFTGDALGAAVELGELACLAVLAAALRLPG